MRLDDIPKLENTGVNFINVHRGTDRVGTGHLPDLHLKLSGTLTGDLSHDNITILADLDIQCSLEHYCMIH